MIRCDIPQPHSKVGPEDRAEEETKDRTESRTHDDSGVRPVPATGSSIGRWCVGLRQTLIQRRWGIIEDRLVN